MVIKLMIVDDDVDLRHLIGESLKTRDKNYELTHDEIVHILTSPGSGLMI